MSILLRHKFWVVIGVVILAAIFAPRIRYGNKPEGTTTSKTGQATAKSQQVVDSKSEPSSKSGSTVYVESDSVSMHDAAREMSVLLSDPNKTPEERVQAVGEVLYLFRQGMGGENPLGHNEMVTSALTGENAKRTAVLPTDSPAIVNGQLVDPWGTPYWFHALSAKEMEVRSAGPDRELFTADDIMVE